MTLWDSNTILEVAGGTLHGPAFAADSVAIDSRALSPGALFVAIKGDRVDGHDYLKDAFTKGAAAALVHRLPKDTQGLGPLVLVKDTYQALLALAAAARARTQATIVAVTGSVGKTGTKEAIRLAAASAGSVHATQGNLNNHFGLPLSLANLPQDMHTGVFELGMNHAGELTFLSRLLQPNIAVITNVEAVHLEFFDSVEAIADAKAEIMEGLRPDGTLILNRDNRHFERLLAQARKRGVARIVTFGAHEAAQYRLMHYALQDLGSQVEAVADGTRITYRLGTIGRHWALASLAALAAVTATGADLANAAAALAHFHEPDGRGALKRVVLPQGPVFLIDDCYNASPSSVKAAIAKLAEVRDGLGQGRKVAVLGDMLELGGEAPDLHRALAVVLREHQIELVYAAGPLMQHLSDALPTAMRGAHAANAAALAPLVAQGLAANDVVLIKGSHGSRMDLVRDALVALSPRHAKETADAV